MRLVRKPLTADQLALILTAFDDPHLDRSIDAAPPGDVDSGPVRGDVIQSLKARAAAAKAAYTNNDLDLVAEIAHAAAGLAATFGILAVDENFSRLEKAARTHDRDRAGELLAALDEIANLA